VILSAIQAIDAERQIPTTVAAELLKNLSPAPARREAQKRAENDHLSPTERIRGPVITAEEYGEWFPDVDRGRDLVPQLSVKDWRRELVKGALQNGATHHPEQVRVGTIHAAKGLESPHVMLFPAYSHKQLERFKNGAEAEERRLFYVGMTRASERVDVVHGYLGGSEFPPLAEF
jgi:superfamily I DNA/RNA helicase